MSISFGTLEGGYPTFIKQHPVKQWAFPCGEVGIKIENTGFGTFLAGKDATITVDWEDNSDLMLLAQLVDALQVEKVARISLDIPYFPYSRQDRRCHPGEGHALKMVAQFINSLGFYEVRTLDAHSNVLEAVVDRLVVIPQNVCAGALPVHDILVAPDAGASKKVITHTQVWQDGTNILQADKTRHPDGSMTVNIPHPAAESLRGKKVCVVDDLCDGGKTFIELAEAILPYEPSVLNLYVTHGFFTKGVHVLKPYYHNIYVCNLMRHEFRGQVTEI